MKFVHVSDTHIGYSQYNLEERRNDFFKAFSDVIDYCIKNKVDFIVHSGDLFHHSKPDLREITRTLELLKRLEDANINFYCIAGNHDRGSGVRDATPLEVLGAALSNFKIVRANKTYIEDGYSVCGLNYLSSVAITNDTIQQYINNMNSLLPKENFNIMLLHFEFKPFFPRGMDITPFTEIDSLNYLGVGHLHEACEPFNTNGTMVVFPGSTEYTAFNEKRITKKGFYEVEVVGGEISIKFIQLNTREFLQKSFSDIEQAIDFLSKVEGEKPVVFLKLITDRYIDREEFFGRLKNLGIMEKFLHIKLETEITTRYSQEELSPDINIDQQILHIVDSIQDQQIKNRVLDLMSIVKSVESMEELELYIKANPELFEF